MPAVGQRMPAIVSFADDYAPQLRPFTAQNLTRFARHESSPVDVLAAALLANLASRSSRAMPSPCQALVAGRSHQWPLVARYS